MNCQGQDQREALWQTYGSELNYLLNGKKKVSWSQLELDQVLTLVIEYGKWFGAAVYVDEETICDTVSSFKMQVLWHLIQIHNKMTKPNKKQHKALLYCGLFLETFQPSASCLISYHMWSDITCLILEFLVAYLGLLITSLHLCWSCPANELAREQNHVILIAFPVSQ